MPPASKGRTCFDSRHIRLRLAAWTEQQHLSKTFQRTVLGMKDEILLVVCQTWCGCTSDDRLIITACRLLKRCEKPDRKEFWKVARLTSVGFLAVGFLGFFVKLIFIPINQASTIYRQLFKYVYPALFLRLDFDGVFSPMCRSL